LSEFHLPEAAFKAVSFYATQMAIASFACASTKVVGYRSEADMAGVYEYAP
jgi:hypothetical protein